MPGLLTGLANRARVQGITASSAIEGVVIADADRAERIINRRTSTLRNRSEMGTGVLADIARDLVAALRRDVTTDWVSRDDVRAKLRSTIKRLLVRHGYPPDAQPGATELVLRQVETFAAEWSPAAGR